MKQPTSIARALLEHWNVGVNDIPTSHVKTADFMADFGGVKVLIEEKIKEDDPEYLAERAAKLDTGEVQFASLPITRNEILSGLVRDASRQLKSSSDQPHDFRLMWFTATGVHAQGNYEQFMATLYGRTNILEMNASGYRRCYYFRYSDFVRRAAVLDGAVVAHTDGRSIAARLCLNAFSPRYEALRSSPVVRPFGTAIEDPLKLEAEGTAFVLDSALSRKQEGPLLEYLQEKYKTGPLMTFDLGYLSASIAIGEDDRP